MTISAKAPATIAINAVCQLPPKTSDPVAPIRMMKNAAMNWMVEVRFMGSGLDYFCGCCDDIVRDYTETVFIGRTFTLLKGKSGNKAGMNDREDHSQPDEAQAAEGLAVPSRRQMLMMGAVATSAVVSIRPALAQSAASVMNCEIPVPDMGRAGQYIAADGRLVPPDTPGAFPAGRVFKGEDVKAAIKGRSLPGTSYEQSQAYMNYIRRLQAGNSGFTCYASLQMPR